MEIIVHIFDCSITLPDVNLPLTILIFVLAIKVQMLFNAMYTFLLYVCNSQLTSVLIFRSQSISTQFSFKITFPNFLVGDICLYG